MDFFKSVMARDFWRKCFDLQRVTVRAVVHERSLGSTGFPRRPGDILDTFEAQPGTADLTVSADYWDG